jgi:U3 small nucleolar RNA-associated protein 25
LLNKDTLIYIPSCFDFIVLHNWLLKREADFISITEYAHTARS